MDTMRTVTPPESGRRPRHGNWASLLWVYVTPSHGKGIDPCLLWVRSIHMLSTGGEIGPGMLGLCIPQRTYVRTIRDENPARVRVGDLAGTWAGVSARELESPSSEPVP